MIESLRSMGVNDEQMNYYSGVMGVPITFLDKFNPEQFEILGSSAELSTPIKKIAKKDDVYQQGGPCFYIRTGEHSLKRIYNRIAIRKKLS